MRLPVDTAPGRGGERAFPFWIKVTATLSVCVFVASSWSNYGFANFLWFSCIGLIGAVLALWFESRMLASMMLLATFVADEIGWCADFFCRLFVGWHPLGSTRYMFDPRYSMFGRAVSLYHLVVPVLLGWMVYRLGYDTRALPAQTLLCTAILLTSYTLTDPVSNINCVRGLGSQPQSLAPAWLLPGSSDDLCSAGVLSAGASRVEEVGVAPDA